MINKKHKIGNCIAKLRKDKGWTQNEFAEKLQVSDKTISKWESNKGDPSIEFLPVIAELFNITIDFLLTGKEQEKIVTMSKLELCAKNDDIEMVKENYYEWDTKNEDNKTLFSYILEYESINLFNYFWTDKYIWNIYGFYGHNDFKFWQIIYKIRILHNDITVVRDLIRLDHIDSKRLYVGSQSNDTIKYDGKNSALVKRKILTNEFIEFILYDKRVSKEIRKQFLVQQEEREFNSPAFSYPYILDIVAKKKDFKLLEELLNSIENCNIKNDKEYNRLVNDRNGNEHIALPFFGITTVLEETIKFLFNEEKHRLAKLSNEINKVAFKYVNKLGFHISKVYIADENELRMAKINKNKSISKKDKLKQSVIFNGLVNIDKLIALDNYNFYKEMIKMPATIKELEIDLIKNKNYKELLKLCQEYDHHKIFELIRDANFKELERMTKEKTNPYLFNTYGKNTLNREINSKYFKKEHPSDSRYVFHKNLINFKDIKDLNDIRLFEHAVKCEENKNTIDWILQYLVENRSATYEIQELLLDNGAKLHKTWTEDDGWGYMVDRDEIDKTATQILKNQIKILKRRKNNE